MAGVPVKVGPGGVEGGVEGVEGAAEGGSNTPEYQVSYGNKYLERLITDASAEKLESGVSAGVRLLETLRAPLNSALGTDTQAAQWLEAIQDLKDKAKPTSTIIGVLGNTGAGKSSVINAILQEESLIPTNGMRACTASATAISWNTSDDPAQLYRAEVDFITREDWATELRNLFHDILDGTGQVSSDCSNPDTEAGLAYAKIKAVYPHQTKALLGGSNPDQLAQERAVLDTVGSVKYLTAADAPTLFRELQCYVDSKEKGTEQEGEMEYWPLIKVVRIFCKAKALATGAVIVDLPGVQDSNAARAAVAGKYLEDCTSIWITSAIQRAVDEKAAKKLLEDSLKRQLRFDGRVGAVTFICTKTDDILVSEVSRSLHLDEGLREKWQHIESLLEEQRQHKQEITHSKDEMFAVDHQIEELDTTVEVWEELSAKLADGQDVYRPNLRSRTKRKMQPRSNTPCKKPHNRHTPVNESSDTHFDDESDASENEYSPYDSCTEDEHATPLTNVEISAELSKIKARKKDLRKSRSSLKETVSRNKKELSALTNKEKTLRSDIKSVCVKARNDYSRAAIKNDFAMGIKELDQEAAMAEDEASFNPDEDIRDYGAISHSLPVFCVSARAYQKLSGHLQKDLIQVDGFPTAEETELPSLQEHTQRITQTGRVVKCRRFLRSLDQFLNSMNLWASSDAGVRLSREEQKADEVFIRMQLEGLKEHLQKAVEACVTAFRRTLAKKLYTAFERAIPKASAEAVRTASSWGAYTSETGLRFWTYKATTRRSGVFKHHDFNEALSSPVFRRTADPWERVLQRSFPSLLEDLARECQRGVSKFHNDTTSGVRRPTANPVGMVMLQRQLAAALNSLDMAPADFQDYVSSRQRKANRGFTPVIQQAMQPAYDICVAESGEGSYLRMRSAMASHVEDVRHTMFRQAFNAVKRRLEHMCDGSEAAMQTFVDDLYMKLKRDYLPVLVQGDLPDAEKKIRASMRKDLLEADLWFAAIAPLTGDGNDRISKESLPERGCEGRDEQLTNNHVAAQPDGVHDMSKQKASVIQPKPLWINESR